MLSNERILAVDDDVMNLAIVRESLCDLYEVRTALDGKSALETARDFQPAVVLLDVMMPHMDGYEVCRQLRRDPHLRNSRIIFVSAKSEVVDRLRGYEVGADDYLTKPFFDDELIAKVRVALKTKSIDEFSIVREQLQRSCGNHSETLAVISQLRDTEDGSHLVNVRGISHLLAAELRHAAYSHQIDDVFLDDLYLASILHDVGKVAVPDHILQKRSDYTPAELEQLKQHTVLGEQILNRLSRQNHKVPMYRMAATVARSHHEAFDGTGYPDGTRGHAIPLAARIVRIADAFDVYIRLHAAEHGATLASTRDEILRCRGSKFDPVIVDAFVTTFDDICELYESDMFVETLELTND